MNMNATEQIYISVVVPVFGCGTVLKDLHIQLTQSLSGITNSYEIILVDDASTDQAWHVIGRICESDKHVKGIRLSRNFGQHLAISAGLEFANGDLIVFMDCDLQDDPDHISKLIQKNNEGYDVVFTKRILRKHSPVKCISSKIYNALFWMFSDQNYDVNAGSLVLFTKKVREEFLKIKDKDRLYIQVLKWIGFKQTCIYVEHRERKIGKSSYTFLKLIIIAIQGWTSHSDKLLKASIYLGFLLAFISFLSGITVIGMYFLHGLAPGWPSIIITILFSTGIILMSIGTAGIYIGKIFDQVKGRPLYIISEKVNC